MPDRSGEPRPGRDEPHDDPPIVDLDAPSVIHTPGRSPCGCEFDAQSAQPKHVYVHCPTHAPHQDHTDYRAAATRGLDTIRRQMGWKAPQNTPTAPTHDSH